MNVPNAISMVIISVDYGDARTGIAACDKMQMLAFPVCVIAEKDREKLISKIAEIAKERGAERFCVGMPVNMDGTLGFRSEACRELGEALKRATNIPVVFRDERLTTVSAHGILNANDVRGQKRKNIVDAVSAVLILEEYLKTF